MAPATALTNLLPLAGAVMKPPIGGAYIGEGMPPSEISHQDQAMGVCGDGGAAARILGSPEGRGGKRTMEHDKDER